MAFKKYHSRLFFICMKQISNFRTKYSAFIFFSLKWSYRGCGEYSLKILPLLFFPCEYKSRCELIFLTVQLLVMFKDTTGIILQVQNECNKSFEILIMVCILCAPSNIGNKTLHCKNKSCCARNSLFPKTVNAIKLPI